MKRMQYGGVMRSKRAVVATLILLPAALFIGSNLINFLRETIASQTQELESAKRPFTIRTLPTTVIRQLEPEGLVSPVELQRSSARLSAENQLEEYSCIVRNNTGKTVAAFSLAWAIIIEVAGKESSVRELQVMDSLIDLDVPDGRKSGAVAPRAEFIAEAGPTYFESNASVKRVGVSIDYVVFEDGTNVGPNMNGSSSRQIALVRDGASKYKEWLVQTYAKSGRSLNGVLQQLRSESIPDELNLIGGEMKQGAYVYRTRMLELYNLGGAAAIEKKLQ